jgi:hypothetical protein
MAARLSWSSLLPGLGALLVLVALAVTLILRGSVGRVSGEKIRLHVLTNQARGVMPGTEVWIEGQRVGTVEAIGFNDPATDTTQRVVVSVEVRERDARQIRRDSEIRIRTGANVVGPIVVYISGGTPRSVAVRDGDTLRAITQPDLDIATNRLELATAEMGPIVADAKQVMASARDRRGTLGAARAERGGGDMVRLRANVARMRDAFGRDAGARVSVMARSRRALAQVDSVRLLLRSDRASVGRFRRDSTLPRTVAHLRDEVDSLRQRLAETDGALGRFASDSAVALGLAGARREMALLFEDMRKRPLRYIAF